MRGAGAAGARDGAAGARGRAGPREARQRRQGRGSLPAAPAARSAGRRGPPGTLGHPGGAAGLARPGRRAGAGQAATPPAARGGPGHAPAGRSTRRGSGGAIGRRCTTPAPTGSTRSWPRPASAPSTASPRCAASPRPRGCSTRPASTGPSPAPWRPTTPGSGPRWSDEALFHDVAMDALVEAVTLDRTTPGAAEARERLGALPRRWREEAARLDRRPPQPRTGADAADAAPARGPAPRRLRSRGAAAGGRAAGAGLGARPRPPGRAGAPGAASTPSGATTAATPPRSSGWPPDPRPRRPGGRCCWSSPGSSWSGSATRPAPWRALEALALDPASEPAALQAFELEVDAGQFERGARRPWSATWPPPRTSRATRGCGPSAAALARDRLGDPARARRHLEAALRADPGPRPGRRGAGAAARRGRRVGALRRGADGAARWEPDPAERVRLLERLAEVQQDRL